MKNTWFNTEKKINIIFSYLFSLDKSLEEEKFWNTLSEKDIEEIQSVKQEKTFDLASLSAKIIWK